MTVPMPATGHEQTVGRWRVARMLAVAGRAAGLALAATPLLRRPPLWLAVAGLAALAVMIAASRSVVKRGVRLGLVPAGVDALDAVRADAAWRGGGAFIGIGHSAGVVHAPAESACLVLGPPRRGKTSAVIVPSVLCARAPRWSPPPNPTCSWPPRRPGRGMGGCTRSTPPDSPLICLMG